MSISVEEIKVRVSERYGAIAEQRLGGSPVVSSCCGPDCCGDAQSTALDLYSANELREIPHEIAEATLGCGNPLAIASLQPDEVVVDLGSGAGLDCFLAARRVGDEGRVIGLDMTDSMLELARTNQAKLGLTNVEFRKGEIEKMPLPDNSADIIISNCVVNLSPDKDAVFREAFRVLKPGGRIAISDVVTRGELPPEFRRAMELWAGCLSGALDEQDYTRRLQAAGFGNVAVTPASSLSGAEIEAWADDAARTRGNGCCGADLLGELDEKIFSAQIQARKPKEFSAYK